MMHTAELPDTVVRAWGVEAATDFANWLEGRLRTAQFSPQVQISAFVARQKVNVLMLERVGNLLLSGEPELIQTPDGNWVWRVPVDLTFPSQGRVGRVGEVDVDARYGEVHYDDALLERIAGAAQQLAQETL